MRFATTETHVLDGKKILLIIGGGIAAYKCLELIRRAQEKGLGVRCIMTRAAEQFVTPLSVASLSRERVFTDLFSLTDEAEMGHIELSRSADLIVVAPATADLLARMASGPGFRPRHHDAAGHRRARPRGAGDERAHVAASGDATQPRHAPPGRRHHRGAQ
jgi:hypothetical protein